MVRVVEASDEWLSVSLKDKKHLKRMRMMSLVISTSMSRSVFCVRFWCRSSQGDCLRQLKLGLHARHKGIEACARKVHCRKAGQMQCFSGTLLMVGRLSHVRPGVGLERKDRRLYSILRTSNNIQNAIKHYKTLLWPARLRSQRLESTYISRWLHYIQLDQ